MLPPRGMLPAGKLTVPVASDAPAPSLATPVLSVPANPDLTSSPGFAGISDCELDCTEPPDPWIAVGPAHVVQAVNQHLRMSSLNGSTVKTIAFGAFFAEAAGQVGGSFDPHVLYDAPLGRWLAVAASYDCSAGHLYLGISTGSDPTSTWVQYRFDFLGSLPDYPGLGVTSDKIVLSANLFSIVPNGGSCAPSQFAGSVLDIVDTAALIAGNSVLFSETTPSQTYFTWRPAVAFSSTPVMHMISEGALFDVMYGTITGTNAGGNLSITASDLSARGVVPGFAQPPVPHGATGFTSQTVDGRPTDALWMNGMLWFVSTYPCTPTGDATVRDCVRITTLSTSGDPPSAVQDFLIGSTGYDYFMGGIGLAADGTLFMVLSVSSATDFIGSYASVHFPVDPPNTYRAPLLLLKTGGATYNGSRWGDYVGVAQDPTDAHRVWQADEYANASGQWSTWISQLRGLFTDIGGSIFVNDILWLYDAGITTGCSATTFCPDAPVTRGQMAAFLDRALSLPTTSTDYFTDDEGSLFETDINRLAAAGITTGCSATTYCPDADVTRGQMAAYLDRALHLASTSTDYFTDDEGSLFETDINRLAAAGITTGCSPTTYCPNEYVTRGQMAAFLHRAFGP